MSRQTYIPCPKPRFLYPRRSYNVSSQLSFLSLFGPFLPCCSGWCVLQYNIWSEVAEAMPHHHRRWWNSVAFHLVLEGIPVHWPWQQHQFQEPDIRVQVLFGPIENERLECSWWEPHIENHQALWIKLKKRTAWEMLLRCLSTLFPTG